ncbi:TPA: aminotransferase class I/II-fold pyridoxal phosphate-dependent enzyme [Vibrio vulnificus]|nr:aminotransferase class I/II-fold pyridoxal phosphate-dependent enzyme [Vibrio vulnificus]HBC3533399.1 aminotransferase class I/II-fold pyridoxal phosphate-dependent enzyme [Vibrio vulnificus]
MDRCEAFWEWEKEFKNSLCEEFSRVNWNKYDEIDAQEEKTKRLIAHNLNIGIENVSIMCGGFDAIFNFFLSQSANKFAIPNQSFFGYEVIAKILNKDVIKKDSQSLLSSDLHKIICTPNNPSGERLEDDVILSSCNTKNPVFIDKTYFYFLHHPSKCKFPIMDNVVTNISLSKSLSMAAIRASILIGDASLINTIESVKKPFHVPIFTSIAIRKVFDSQWIKYFDSKTIELDNIRLKKINLLSEFEFEDPKSNFLSIPKQKNLPKEIIEISRDMGETYRLTLRDKYE